MSPQQAHSPTPNDNPIPTDISELIQRLREIRAETRPDAETARRFVALAEAVTELAPNDTAVATAMGMLTYHRIPEISRAATQYFVDSPPMAQCAVEDLEQAIQSRDPATAKAAIIAMRLGRQIRKETVEALIHVIKPPRNFFGDDAKRDPELIVEATQALIRGKALSIRALPTITSLLTEDCHTRSDTELIALINAGSSIVANVYRSKMHAQFSGLSLRELLLDTKIDSCMKRIGAIEADATFSHTVRNVALLELDDTERARLLSRLPQDPEG